MPFASKCDTSSSTHFIFNYININAIHLAIQSIVETLTHYGKNEDYCESAFWFVQILVLAVYLNKAVHGSGCNPAEPPHTRCKLWFNKSINGTKLVGNTPWGVPKQMLTVPYTVSLRTAPCI